MNLRSMVPLAPYSWWKIGGPADVFFDAPSQEALISVLRFCRQGKIPVCVIGQGTNLLFDDTGFRGCVIRVGQGLSDIELNGSIVAVGAGCWVPRLAFLAARAGLSGLEHTIGIPASLGGLLYMNGGSQRKGIGEVVKTVTSLTQSGKFLHYAREDCGFSYRKSRFQESSEIILSAVLKLDNHRTYGDQRPELLSILASRNRKFPRKLPSCGSVFKSSAPLFSQCGPPGKIIEELGFKGYREGYLEVSRIHANFITNLGGGSSVDALNLVRKIHHRVFQTTGFSMEPEFQFVHPVHGIMPSEEWL